MAKELLDEEFFAPRENVVIRIPLNGRNAQRFIEAGLHPIKEWKLDDDKKNGGRKGDGEQVWDMGSKDVPAAVTFSYLVEELVDAGWSVGHVKLLLRRESDRDKRDDWSFKMNYLYVGIHKDEKFLARLRPGDKFGQYDPRKRGRLAGLLAEFLHELVYQFCQVWVNKDGVPADRYESNVSFTPAHLHKGPNGRFKNPKLHFKPRINSTGSLVGIQIRRI